MIVEGRRLAAVALSADGTVVVGVVHIDIGRMAPTYWSDAVAACFGTGNAAIAVIVVLPQYTGRAGPWESPFPGPYAPEAQASLPGLAFIALEAVSIAEREAFYQPAIPMLNEHFVDEDAVWQINIGQSAPVLIRSLPVVLKTDLFAFDETLRESAGFLAEGRVPFRGINSDQPDFPDASDLERVAIDHLLHDLGTDGREGETGQHDSEAEPHERYCLVLSPCVRYSCR